MTDESQPKNKHKKIKTITVTLSTPIEWGDETIKELVLRRPKAKDLDVLSANPNFRELLSIAQRCAKVPKRVIDDLDADDALEVVEAVADFLESGQRITRKRSY